MDAMKLRMGRKFSTDKQPYLKGHRLNGVIVVSGATLMTSIAEFIQQLGNRHLTTELCEIFFCCPLLIQDSTEVDVDIEWDKSRGRIIAGHDGQTCAVCCLNGNSCISDNGTDGCIDLSLNSKFYPPEVIDKTVSATDFYAFMCQRGYQYDGSFHGVNEVRLTVEKPNENHRTTLCYGMCLIRGDCFDVIIDCAFQAMVHAILMEEQKDDNSMIVPFSIDKMCLRSSKTKALSECKIYAIFRVCVEKRTGDCFVKCNGKGIFAAEEVLFRPMRRFISLNREVMIDDKFVNKSVVDDTSVKEVQVKYGIRAMSCRLPGSVNSPAEFWQLLADGRVTDRRIPADRIPTRNRLLRNSLVEGANFISQNIQDFDATFFGISRAESEAMDPQQRLLLECVHECMENAGLKTLAGRTGFFVGLMSTEYPDIVEAADRRDMLSMLGSSASIVAGRLNYYFDGVGPALCVDTACSSSLACVDLAIQAIASERCQRAIVAGVNLILTEKSMQQRANGKMLSWDGACRTFDANASGYGRSDGCVAILIEQVQDEQRYEAIIENVNVNHNGRSTALTAPNPAAQSKLISDCLDGMNENKLLFWECHGTGTPLGDPIEYVALKSALSSKILTSSSSIFVSSAKASIGHCEAASGLVGLLKAVLQLQNAYIPRIPRFCVLNEQIRRYDNSNAKLSLKIPICGAELIDNEQDSNVINMGGISSFGVSGTNACILVSVPKYKNSHKIPTNSDSITVLPIWAKSVESLENNLIRCIETLKDKNGQLHIPKIIRYCHAYALNRTQYRHRLAIVFRAESGGLFSSEVIRKATDKIINFKFIAEIWPTFEFDLFCRIPAYRMNFQQALSLIGIPIMDVLAEQQNGITLVADMLAKYNMLINWGVEVKECIAGSRDDELSAMLLELLKKFESAVFLKCAKLAENRTNRQDKQLNEINNDEKDLLNGTIGQATGCQFKLDSVEAVQQLIVFAHVSGHSLNWEKIYSSHILVNDVSLPNYVFNRKPYWICKQSKTVTHGLIGNLVSENEDYVTFENLITARRLPFLHRVRRSNERLFPLGAVLEMIIASAYCMTTSGKTGDGVRITNIALPKLTDWLTGDFWLSTTVNIRFSTLEMLIGDKKVPLGNANFCSVKNLRKEKWAMPEVQQHIDERKFKRQIFKNSNIDYSDFDRVDVFLDSACNIVKIATDSNPIVDGDFVINPVLLETFAQILLNYGVIKDYDVIVRQIKMIEIFKRIDRFCYINIDDNVIESFDSNRDLAMRFVLDLSVTKAESNILSLPIIRSQLEDNGLDSPAINRIETLNKEEITRRIMNALEDSLARESPLDQNSIDVGFVDLGLDSLSLIGFLNKINDEYFPGFSLTSTELFSNPTILALTSFISTRHNNFKAEHTATVRLNTEKETHKEVVKKEEMFLKSTKYVEKAKVIRDGDNKDEVHAYNLVQNEEEKFHEAIRLSVNITGMNTVQVYVDDKFIKNWTITEMKNKSAFLIKTISQKCYGHKLAKVKLSFSTDYMTVNTAARFLLLFGKSLINCIDMPFLQFCISDDTNPLDGLAAGFFKSLAAEKPKQLGFHFSHRLERVKILDVAFPYPAPCGGWLITGGTSGIGFEMAEYLALNYNVTVIGIVGRRPIKDKLLLERLQKIRRFCEIRYLQADVGDYNQLRLAFDELLPHLPSRYGLEGVIHSAGCTRDNRIELMSENAFDEVLRPKCLGLENLERCLKDFCFAPTFFIINSSISSTFGNPSQCNYSAANSWADAFVRHRRRDGFSGTSIQWGNWLETGMAARLGVNPILEAIGFRGLNSKESMKYFRFVLETNPEAIVIANIDWMALLKKRSDLSFEYCSAELFNHSINIPHEIRGEMSSTNLYDKTGKKSNSILNDNRRDSGSTVQLQGTSQSPEKWKQYSDIKDEKLSNEYSIKSGQNRYFKTSETIKMTIKHILAKFIGEENLGLAAYADGVGLIELGLDSLKLSIFATELQAEFSANHSDLTISVIDLFQNPTVDKLANHIWAKIGIDCVECSNSTEPRNLDTVIISYDDLQIIDQHRVGDDIVVPAAFQIRQFERFSKAKFMKDIFLKNLIYKRNISSLKLKTNRLNNNKFRLNLKSDSDENVIFSSSISFQEHQIDEENAKIFAQHVRLHIQYYRDFTKSLNENLFYDGMRGYGIDYGKAFQLLTNIVISGDFVTAKIKIDLKDEESSWRFYDAALQALSAVLFDPSDASYYVPIQIDTFWQMFSEFDGNSQHYSESLIVYGHIFQRQDHFLRGTVALLFSDKIIMFMEGVTAMRLRRELISPSNTKPVGLGNDRNVKEGQGKNNSKVGFNLHSSTMTQNCSKDNKLNVPFQSSNQSKVAVIGWSGGYTEQIVECYDAEFFNINAKEAPFVDPQQRLLLEAVVEALECAQLTSLPAASSIFIGGSSSDFAQRAFAELDAVGYMATGTNNSVLSGRIAHYLGAAAGAETIDSACSSFTVALARACDALCARRCEFAVVGAVNVLLNTKTSEVLRKLGVLSAEDRCASFDADADGYRRSGAAGAIILQRVDTVSLKKLKHPVVTIAGWATGHAGSDAASLTVSSTVAQRRIIETALYQAAISNVDLIECHGSATLLGDPIEALSILQTFPKTDHLLLSAAKSKYGHCEAAAGLVSFLEMLKTIQTGYLKSFHHFKCLNPKIRAMVGAEKLICPVVRMEVDVRSVLINNFAFNGTNAATVLVVEGLNCSANEIESELNDELTGRYPPSSLLLISAKSAKSLRKSRRQISEYFCENEYHQRRAIYALCDVFMHGRCHYRPYRSAYLIDFTHHEGVTLGKIGGASNSSSNRYTITISTAEISPEGSLMTAGELKRNSIGFRNFAANLKMKFSAESDLNSNAFNLAIAEFITSSIHISHPIKLKYRNDGDRRYFSQFGSDRIRTSMTENLQSREEFHIDLSEIFDSRNRPSSVLNYIFGRLFVAGVPFDIDLFMPKKKIWNRLDFKFPGYVFNRRRFWPFEDGQKKINQSSFSQTKILNQTRFRELKSETAVDFKFYHRTFEPINFENNYGIGFVTFETIDFGKDEATDENAFRQIQTANTDNILIIWPRYDGEETEHLIRNFLRFRQFLEILARVKLIKLIVLVEDNSPAVEIVAFLRSVAAERPNLVYRLISTAHSISSDFIFANFHVMRSSADSSHIWCDADRKVFVERLIPVMHTQVNGYSLNGLETERFGKVLITGGSSGLAMELIHRLNAETIISVSRKAISSNDSCIRHYVADCCELAAMRKIFQSESNISSIFHCAGAVANRRVEQLIADDYRRVFAPKVKATRNLLALCQEFNVPKFVAVSSAAAVLGSAGQANYATANAFMEKICSESTVKTFLISFGPLEDVGMLAGERLAPIRRQIVDAGWRCLRARNVVDEIIAISTRNETSNILIFAADWQSIKLQQLHLTEFLHNCNSKNTNQRQTFNTTVPHQTIKSKKYIKTARPKTLRYRRTPKIRLKRSITVNQNYSTKIESFDVMRPRLESIDRSSIGYEILAIIRRVSGLADPQRDINLMAMGVDSLMVEEIRSEAARQFCVTLSIAEMYAFVTVDELAGLIHSKLAMNTQENRTVESQVSSKISSFLFSKTIESDLTEKSISQLSNGNLAPTSQISNDDRNVNNAVVSDFWLNEKRGKLKSAEYTVKNCLNDQLTSKIVLNGDDESECVDKTAQNVMDTNGNHELKSIKDVDDNQFFDDDIAIIAMSGTFSGSRSIDEFWENLLAGRESMTQRADYSKDEKCDSDDDNISTVIQNRQFIPVSGLVPDAEVFDPAPFAISEMDAQMLDPQVRCSLLHAHAALEQSGYFRRRSTLRVGCFVGAEPSGFPHSASMNESSAEPPPRGSLTEMFARNQKDFCAAWISYALNLRGPSVAVYAACATGLVAVRQAADALTRRAADLCLAGAIHLIPADDVGHDFEPGMLLASRAECRPFAMQRDSGILRGSGCAVFVLKLARSAFCDGDRILGVLKSCALTNDGSGKSNFMAPGLKGLTTAMADALAAAGSKGVHADDVAYLECHATGTLVGDSIELQAVANAFELDTNKKKARKQSLLVGSVKANIGHAFAASGMASLAKCLKILETGIVPAQLGMKTEQSLLFSDKISISYSRQNGIFSKSMRTRCVALNSFGIGGTNACAVLVKSPERQRVDNLADSRPPLIDGAVALLPISAATVSACISACRVIAVYLKQLADENPREDDDIVQLKKVARTLQFRRASYRWRIAIVVRSLRDAAERLERVDETIVQRAADGPLGVENLAAYFAPQGVQYPEMLRNELRDSTWLRQRLDALAEPYDEREGATGVLKQILASDAINDARHTQCALFAICRTASAFVAEALGGNRPSLLFGHSVGEYAALTEAEALSESEAMRLLRIRGRLIAETKSAKMLIVHYLNNDDPLLAKWTPGIEESARLSARWRVLVGEPMAIDALCQALKAAGRECRPLKTAHGFHSSFLDPILTRFADASRCIRLTEPRRAVLSNVNGRVLTADRLNTNYLCAHLRLPVRLDLTIDAALTHRPAIRAILEFGPPGMLENLVQQRSAELNENESDAVRKISVIKTMQSRWEALKDDGLETLLFASVARLWELGFVVDFERVTGGASLDYNLPGYQFDLRPIPRPIRGQRSVDRPIMESKIYRQSFKFEADLNKIELGTLSWDWSRTLLVTNSETVSQRLGLNGSEFTADRSDKSRHPRPLTTVLLTNDNKETFKQTGDGYFVLSAAHETSFMRLREEINQKLVSVIFYFDTQDDDDMIENSSKIRANLNGSFMAFRRVTRHVSSRFTDKLMVYCMAGPNVGLASATIFAALSAMRHEIPAISRAVMIDCVRNDENEKILSYFSDAVVQNDDGSMDFEWFRLKNQTLMRMFYEKDRNLLIKMISQNNEKEKHLTKKNPHFVHKNDKHGTVTQSTTLSDEFALILGGTGDVGMNFARVLHAIHPSISLIFVSRRATALRLDSKFVDARFFDVDLEDLTQVERHIESLQSGRCRYLVQCAGLAPDENQNTVADNEFEKMFAAKIYGTMNVLTACVKFGLEIDVLILNSSLTAINGLPGAVGYAAANIFLDALATQLSNKRGCRVLSIQWPAWRNSRMFRESRLSADTVVRNAAISARQARCVIRALIEDKNAIGVFAVGTQNPVEMRRYFMKNTANNANVHVNTNMEKYYSNSATDTEKGSQLSTQNLKEELRALWTVSLRNATTVINDDNDFFALGGDSLSAVQLAWRVERALAGRVRVPPDWLMESPRFADFWQKVEVATRQNTAVLKRGKNDLLTRTAQKWIKNGTAIPLSLPQEQMWLLWQLERDSAPRAGRYNIIFQVDIAGSLNVPAVEWALRRLCAAQPTLRTRFPAVRDSSNSNAELACQEIFSLTESFYIFEWNFYDSQAAEAEECARDFDLSAAPPFCLRTFTSIDGGYSILVNQHHILTDGWSMTVFARQLAEFYRMAIKMSCSANEFSIIATVTSSVDALKNLMPNVTYADYAIWNRRHLDDMSAANENKLAQLANRLAQLPPGGTTFETRLKDRTANYDNFEMFLSCDETRRLDAFCASAKTTRYIALLAAFLRAVDVWRADAAVVSAPTLVIGCAVAGRPAAELEPLIGYFLNNVVVAVETGSESPLWQADARQVVAYVRSAVDSANATADVPFHRAVALMRRARDGENPVFQIFFNYRHNLDFPRAELGADVCTSITQISRNRVFPLSCTVDEIGDRVRLTLDYTTRWLDAQMARSFAHEIIAHMHDIFDDKNDAATVWRRCADVGAATAMPPIDLVAALRGQALLTPKAIAICRVPDGGCAVSLTYAQLWARVEAQSRWLRHCYFCELAAQLRQDDIIALVFADNNTVVYWMLTVLNCGAAYCVIDAHFPPARIAKFLATLGSRLALSDVELSLDPLPNCRIINVTMLNRMSELGQEYRRNLFEVNIFAEAKNRLDLSDKHLCSSRGRFYSDRTQRIGSFFRTCQTVSTTDHLAYVCFTSGTTGTPKGVCVTQRNVLAFVGAATRRLGVDERSRVAHSVNCAFDVAVFNVFGSLLNGACLVQLDSIMHFVEPIPTLNVELNALINRPLTHLFLNSAIFNALNDAELRRLAGASTTRLIVGGETPSSQALQICVAQRDACVEQIYGPTETTVWSMVQRVTADCYDGAVIGTIQTNELAILVHPLNPNARLARYSLAIGELAIGGAGVARGYLNGGDIAPFIELPGIGRVYRTGDLMRRIDSNTYRFLGRNDARLKIGGIRVDPTEVSDAVATSWQTIGIEPALAAVFVCGELVDNKEIELVAFCSTGEEKDSPTHLYIDSATVAALKNNLASRLPCNAIPTVFILVNQLPISRIGKVDRLALRACYNKWRATMSNSVDVSKSINEKSNLDVLARLSAIWRDILNIKAPEIISTLEPEENFFALGGHSLLLFRLKRRIGEEFSNQNNLLDIEIGDLFRHPTIGAQSQLIAGRLTTSVMPAVAITIAPTISLLRDASGGKSPPLNVYCIHAIGGTLYPYYPVLGVLPAVWRIYGVHFDGRVDVASLRELARLYARQIVAHQPLLLKPFLLFGHSLGGILAREIAIIINASTRPLFLPFVVAIDSWALGTETLDLDVVREYLTEQFRLMPNRDLLLSGAMRLASWLRAHEFRRADVGVRLFKATTLGEHSLRRCIRNPAAARALPTSSDNGWAMWTDALEVFRCDGDHDSILRADALAPYRDTWRRFGEELSSAAAGGIARKIEI